MQPSPGRTASNRRRKRKVRSSPMANLFGLLLLFSPGNAQFGEIASIVTSLLANGGGAGLAGLAGQGASLGSLGAASAGAGAGAANAAGNIGTLYQLAQAALQLTGTGVGIANQASESAWFPVAVASATKMHKDFQDRLLTGGAGRGTGLGGLDLLGGMGTKGRGEGPIGKEYGKEFGEETEGGGEGGENSLGGLPDSGPESIFSSRVSLLPNLLPMPMGPFTPAPPFGGTSFGMGGLPGLPGLSRLLPGEAGQTGGEAARGVDIEFGGRAGSGIGTDRNIASRKAKNFLNADGEEDVRGDFALPFILILMDSPMIENI